MSYRVLLTARAESDIDTILGYLRKRSSQGAGTWAATLDDVLTELEVSADQAALAPENEDHSEEIRHIIFRTPRGRSYRLLYFVRLDEVIVTHVRGPGQDIVQ